MRNSRRRLYRYPSGGGDYRRRVTPNWPLEVEWWQDEEPVVRTGSTADPEYDDYDTIGRAPWAPAYIGEGNYSSGEFDSEAQHDYDYAYGGFKGDAGFDYIGDQQYGGGRYGAGPYEQSDEFGGDEFRRGYGPYGRLQREFDERHLRSARPGSHAESGAHDRLGYGEQPGARPAGEWRHRFPGAPGWRDAPDMADPAGFRTFVPHAREHRMRMPPKGYQRSDDRVLEEIYLNLLSRPHIDSGDVSVEVHRGMATLTGSVTERSMKHAIENVVAGVWGVNDVENQIRVARE